MKPSTIRNRTIYAASLFTRSKQMCSHLSKELQQKYNRRSIRVTKGDTVRVMRGEFKGVTGKITKVSTEKNGAAVEGIKKEKLKGGNLDVFIHTSNLLVTDINTEDKWRQNKLEGKNPKPPKEAKLKEEKPKEEKPKEVKPEAKPEAKQQPKPQPKQEKQEKSKTVKKETTPSKAKSQKPKEAKKKDKSKPKKRVK
ncbi:MAG TPA: 50S ribosomal protein L24 [Candidatus Nitrosotenuis sp.]|nr:50S ribosomal protein L24 [Candidatus Nitrosotenuis sp.]